MAEQVVRVTWDVNEPWKADDTSTPEGYGRFLAERLFPELCGEEWPDKLPGPPVNRTHSATNVPPLT